MYDVYGQKRGDKWYFRVAVPSINTTGQSGYVTVRLDQLIYTVNEKRVSDNFSHKTLFDSGLQFARWNPNIGWVCKRGESQKDSDKLSAEDIKFVEELPLWICYNEVAIAPIKRTG